MGYLIADKLKDRIKKDKNDLEAKSLFKEMGEYLKIGKRNHIAYLSSDHLDVYVATSNIIDHVTFEDLVSQVHDSKQVSTYSI